MPDKRLCGPAAMLIEEVLELLGELTAEVDLQPGMLSINIKHHLYPPLFSARLQSFAKQYLSLFCLEISTSGD